MSQSPLVAKGGVGKVSNQGTREKLYSGRISIRRERQRRGVTLGGRPDFELSQVGNPKHRDNGSVVSEPNG